jgi:hypothetical protein
MNSFSSRVLRVVGALVVGGGLILALGVTGQAPDLKVCKSTFALCTIAPCDAIAGNDKQV